MMAFTLFKEFVMKRTTVIAVCVSLLFGGLLCLHLAAQSDKTEVKAPVSLLDMKIKDSGERELLEMKVESCRKIVDLANLRQQAPPTRGNTATATRHTEAYVLLATAEIELYHHIGDRVKLFVALDAKVEALTQKLHNATELHRNGMITSDEVCETEIQLLDALLERKRMAK
jgi:NhaP-type Na+/H+ and K+/H+ antiporter